MLKKVLFSFILITSASALTFTCNFKFTTLDYTCNDPTISFINDSEFLTEVNGKHLNKMNNLDVKNLFISGPKELTFFPKGIQNFFPNLNSIKFTKTGIISLNGDEFQAFPDLNLLDFSQNSKLERIPGNSFEFNPLITYIYFNQCNLRFIGEGLFSGLQNLLYLNVQDNFCVNDIGFYDMSRVLGVIERNCSDTRGN